MSDIIFKTEYEQGNDQGTRDKIKTIMTTNQNPENNGELSLDEIELDFSIMMSHAV
jgi:hypothetical protein